jgi:hypothetical protein
MSVKPRKTKQDATRRRRVKDKARQRWYAHWRSIRWARHFFGADSRAV